MDGLSAAASGIAVVSLAIQLVDSVREIRHFLRNVSEAPKELRRLIDLLEQLELILENIGALVERRQQHAVEPAIDMSASILRAMRTCESKLKLLEDIVAAAKKTSSSNGKVKRTFGSFKLACKKKDIQEFESQLHDAISLLNLAMTTNLTVVHAQSIGHLLEQVTATHQMTTTISKELLVVRNPPMNTAVQECSTDPEVIIQNSRPPAETMFSTRRSRTISEFCGPLGRLIVKKEVQNSNFENEEESTSANTHYSESSAWIFMPSFLSYAFDYRYLNTCGYVERTLRTYPILPLEHPVWDMCFRGDLTGIQELLGDRQISPFSVDEDGDTLLHHSAVSYQAELCKFLFEIGLTGRETNNSGQ
ncbi:hypothetical protein NA56DRAFT_341580 [Hyaloscypha hepaticicola]|uniref:Azaphilone pigments biosynthesis cluster protein L N-terminal domain-containing protein n=1 Tax=Hyaloscypha hepaticicola TaxID=2082293 RepID=A0A2J6QJ49_9HELO|nr:hypothetical protein NA56DRAFT_341580 [Hyaloscypha hepaticicola]